MSIDFNMSDQELHKVLGARVEALESEDYLVTFGEIGRRTTYCMLSRGDREIVGYTYIRGDLSGNRPVIGRLKALMQAINRKYLLYDSTPEGF